MPSEKRQRQRQREHAVRAEQAAQNQKAQRRRTMLLVGGIVVLAIGFAALYSVFAGDDGGDDTATGTTVAAAETTTTTIDPALQADCPAEDGSSPQQLEFDAPQQDCLVEGATYEAVFDTTAGEIRVALDTETTPQTVNNFVVLARYHYYDGVDIFRSNTGIDILQSGSPHTNNGADPGPGYSIPDEGGPYTYEAGDLVMARGGAPNSASAQFFFSTGPNTALLDSQGTYVVFGQVTEGMDVLEAIMATHVEDADSTTPEGEGAPVPTPVINSVTIVQS